MHRLTLYLLGSLVFALGVAPVVQAHVLEQSNGMSAVMHIDPDDDPVAGQASQLEFFFGTNLPQARFNLTDCVCKVELSEGSKQLSQLSLTPHDGSLTAGEASLTFPEVGDYALTLVAHSKTAVFPDFTLRYHVPVDQTLAMLHAAELKRALAAFGVAAVLLIGFVVARPYLLP